MSNIVVKTFDYTGGRQTFTMPVGYHPEVEVHMWGAGGGGGGSDGNGPGGQGGGGWYYTNTITLAAGDTVDVCVGGGGIQGGSGTSSGSGRGGYGRHSFVPSGYAGYGAGRSFAGGSGGNAGPSGWSGGGGGGGGASVLIINNSTHYVAAGGGGGGGGSWNRAGANAVNYNSPSAYSNFATSTNGAYVAWLNTYGIWNADIYSATFDQTFTINCPVTGTYTFVSSCDNSGTIYLDGSSILSVPGYGATYTYSATVAAGVHTVRIYGSNSGGPGSIGLTVQGPMGIIFATNALPYLTQGTNGVSCVGDGAGGGGGGGGLTGGAGGDQGFDNSSGGSGGYTGTSSSGGQQPPGNTPAGATSSYYASPVGLGTYGDGNGGRIVLVLTASSFGGVKVSGTWKGLDSTYVKVGGAWKRLQAGWTKVNGEWRLLKGFGAPTITPAFESTYFGGAYPAVVPATSVSSPPDSGGQGGGGDGGGQTGDSGGGGGGGCFLAGTLITMADGTTKPIDTIQIGDVILEALTNTPTKVIGVKTRAHDVSKWVFSLDKKVKPYITEEHPFYDDNNELCAISELATKLAPWLGPIKIVDVPNKKKIKEAVTVYNLMLETGESHYANGVKVNNIVKTGTAYVLLYRGLMSAEAYENYVYNTENQTVSAEQQARYFELVYTITNYVLHNDNIKGRCVGRALAWAITNRETLKPYMDRWFKSRLRKLIFGKNI